jgi:tRNA A37 threonylcarbamoyladenosine biosynthesis protein TsaE
MTESIVLFAQSIVIAKWYRTNHSDFYTLVHIDAYRIESEQELSTLGFSGLLREPKALVIIEWPERIPNILAELNAQTFTLHHEGEIRVIEGPLPYEKAK